MSINFVAYVRKEGKITIPKEIRDQHKINEGDLLDFSLRKPNWWDMLDWDSMGKKAWNRLPDDIKNKLRDSGKAPEFDTMILE